MTSLPLSMNLTEGSPSKSSLQGAGTPRNPAAVWGAGGGPRRGREASDTQATRGRRFQRSAGTHAPIGDGFVRPDKGHLVIDLARGLIAPRPDRQPDGGRGGAGDPVPAARLSVLAGKVAHLIRGRLAALRHGSCFEMVREA